jgi:hypothetical protein
VSDWEWTNGNNGSSSVNRNGQSKAESPVALRTALGDLRSDVAQDGLLLGTGSANDKGNIVKRQARLCLIVVVVVQS